MSNYLGDFIMAYNFAKRLKTLSGLTPYEYICKLWTTEPDLFRIDPLHQNAGTKHLVADTWFILPLLHQMTEFEQDYIIGSSLDLRSAGGVAGSHSLVRFRP
jgi:hypothetical protein